MVGGDPLVFGGDMNLRPARNPIPFDELRERLAWATQRGRTRSTTSSRATSRSRSGRGGFRRSARAAGADGLRLRLSDHAPVITARLR